MKLTIRENGKYWQLGYYDKSKWINIKQLGTPENLAALLNVPLPETYQKFKAKLPKMKGETYHISKGTLSIQE